MRSLDEYTSEELVRELSKRHYLRMSAHKCPYCEKPIDKVYAGQDRGLRCTCRFADMDAYHPPGVLNSLQYGGSCDG